VTDSGTRHRFLSAAGRTVVVQPLEIDVGDEAVNAGEALPAVVWSESLQQFARALVRAVSFEDVAAAIATYAGAVVGARCAHVALLDEGGRMALSVFTAHGLPSRRLSGRGASDRFPWDDTLRAGTTHVFASTDDLHKAYPDVVDVWDAPTTGPVVTLPLRAAGEICGAITFGLGPGSAVPAGDDTVLTEIAALAAQAAARAALYDTERRSTEVLQSAYLPVRLPRIAGLQLASRYFPADQPFVVGGDWYDAIELTESRVGLIIGDVAGHGFQAATIMGSLRSALRAFATVDPSPAVILTRLNTYVCMFKPEAFATALVAVFDPADGLLRYASAGHPPGLLVGEDGSVELLTEPLGPPLGLSGTRYGQGERPLPSGSALIIYTDGLVERRRTSIDGTIADLVRAASAEGATNPDDICDRLTGRLLSDVEMFDDAGLLVAVRNGPADPSPVG
jgi:hypothetical protein